MISYLHNKNWIDFSREERLFCAHLYFDIKKNVKRFIEFLNLKNDSIKNDIHAEWEIAYEVCFYRDWLKNINQSIKDKPDYPQKRTFDLCLFSENKIIIIEAKAQQGFQSTQNESFEKDIKIIQKMFAEFKPETKISIEYCFLGQSKNVDKEYALDVQYKISWKEIFELYNDSIYNRADICI